MSTTLGDGDEQIQIKWFEKSVEYQFMTQAVLQNIFSFVFPLSGDEEFLGDTVFVRDSNYVIVEFKVDLCSLSGEYSKYKIMPSHTKSDKKNFVAVRDAFLASVNQGESPWFEGKNHILIGGVNNGDGTLGLQIVEYFSAANPDGDGRWKVVEIEKIRENAIPKDQFEEYVSKLFLHKKPRSVNEATDDESTDVGSVEEGTSGKKGGGSGGPKTKRKMKDSISSFVLGISTNSKYVGIEPLESYHRELVLELSANLTANTGEVAATGQPVDRGNGPVAGVGTEHVAAPNASATNSKDEGGAKHEGRKSRNGI